LRYWTNFVVLKSCTGKILNLLSFKSNQCNNTDNTTPFLWNQKFTAQPGETTSCTKINIDGGVVNSFVYTNDGIDNGTCTLQLYKSDTCTDIPRTDFGVTDMASDCKTQTFRAVKLQCD